jgi:hypothetical protein
VRLNLAIFRGITISQFVLLSYVFLLLYDGALRKWVLQEQEIIVFILKDIVLVLGLFFVLVTQTVAKNISLHPAVLPLVAVYFLWIALAALNPWLPNYLVAIWGVKSYALVAITVFVLLPLAFAHSASVLQMLARGFPYIVMPICLIGIAQVFSPADSWLNRQVRDDVEAIAYFGDSNLVRVTGTFSYISGMGAFVQTACLLGFGLFLAGARSKSFLVAFGVVLAAVPVTGSRAVIVFVGAGCALMLLVAPFARLISVKTAARIAFIGGFLAFASSYALFDVWQALQQRSESTFGEANRFVTAFTNAFDYFEAAGVAGFGTGSANLGAPALAKDLIPFSWLPGNLLFEEESGRIVIELGILGWVLGLAMRFSLLFWALSLAISGANSVVRVVGTIALPVMAIAFYQGIGVFASPVWSAYVWFCFALLAMAHHENVVIRKRLDAEREAALYRTPQ